MDESLIHFETDVDCIVYKYGSFLCEVNCGKDTYASFRKGLFKLKFVSSANPADYYETIYNVPEAGIETFYTITLKPIQDKRLQEEQKERDNQIALQRKAEQEERNNERLKAEQQRKSEALKHARTQFVDLGLSVKWGTCNLGTTDPEKDGGFFAWGETNAKHTFGAGVYKHFESAGDQIHFKGVLKYGKSAKSGENKFSLDSIDDAATTYLGKGYRIPTEQEWNELKWNCFFEKFILNGVEGYIVRSRKKGFENKSIFLPLAGGYSWRGYSKGASCYWTSDLENDKFYRNVFAKVFVLQHSGCSNCTVWSQGRENGYPIRPVCDK